MVRFFLVTSLLSLDQKLNPVPLPGPTYKASENVPKPCSAVALNLIRTHTRKG